MNEELKRQIKRQQHYLSYPESVQAFDAAYKKMGGQWTWGVAVLRTRAERTIEINEIFDPFTGLGLCLCKKPNRPNIQYLYIDTGDHLRENDVMIGERVASITENIILRGNMSKIVSFITSPVSYIKGLWIFGELKIYHNKKVIPDVLRVPTDPPPRRILGINHTKVIGFDGLLDRNVDINLTDISLEI